ncbi:MAG: RNA 2',3'-cyclic phosphodiesterase [Bacteroidota bacterium]
MNPAAPRTKGRRTFVAVPLPPSIRRALFDACADLERSLPGVKWSRKIENFHVTLKFLGRIADDRVLDDIATGLSSALGALPAFPVGVRGAGAFPTARLANVIWAGVDDPTGGLARIARVVTSLTEPFVTAQEDVRPFRAHVTLGRSKTGADARAALEAMSGRVFGRFTVDEVHVYESLRGPDGSTYLARSRARFDRE